MKCKYCNVDLYDYGISVEAINHYKYDNTQGIFIVNDCSLLPYDDSKVTCGNCNEELDITLNDFNCNFII